MEDGCQIGCQGRSDPADLGKLLQGANAPPLSEIGPKGFQCQIQADPVAIVERAWQTGTAFPKILKAPWRPTFKVSVPA